MKVWRLIITIGLPGFLIFSSCSLDPVQNTDKPIKVLLPWTDGSSKYKFQEVEIKTIKDLDRVQGPYVEFHYQPTITMSGTEGTAPKARWSKNAQGLYIPADYLSTQMFTIYAHMEQLAEFDRKLGLFDKKLWPRKIGITLPIKGDLSAKSHQQRNNAFYHSADNSIVILPYRLPDLPLAVNSGVLAHEHFHSHFHNLVQKPLNSLRPELFEFAEAHDDIDPYYLYFVLRALNEGIADYWGWVYSGQTDFVGKSLPSIDELRTLKGQSQKIEGPFFRNLISRHGTQRGRFTPGDESMHMERITSIAYSSGANLARVFRELTERYQRELNFSSEDAKTLVIHRFIKTLNLLREDLNERQSFDDFSLVTFFELYLLATDEPSEEECSFIIDSIEHQDADKITEICRLADVGLIGGGEGTSKDRPR